MIDTVKLRSPYLTAAAADMCELSLDRILRVNLGTGKQEYELTTGLLEGSWDNRISVRLEREDWVEDHEGKKLTKTESEPYLVVEGSVHKALLGHNAFGGPVDVYASCRWFVALLGRLLGVDLPDGAEWQIRRIDIAHCYELGRQGVEEYLGSLCWASYPRRRVIKYGSHTVMAPGDMTTVKVYDKGTEYRKHDMARLKGVDSQLAYDVAVIADGIVRVEVGIKARKLDTQGSCLVGCVQDEWLEEVWALEVCKLVRECEGLEVLRESREVRSRLYEVYGSRLAKALFGTWMELAGFGEEETRSAANRASFYRHRKQLQAAGVSWIGSDVVVRKAAIPSGFSLMGTKYRLSGVADSVREQLEGYARAA